MKISNSGAVIWAESFKSTFQGFSLMIFNTRCISLGQRFEKSLTKKQDSIYTVSWHKFRSIHAFFRKKFIRK